jgi:uncharacterized protein (TIGR02145 family)
MMRKLLTLLAIGTFSIIVTRAQSVGIGTTTPNRSAQLDVQSNNKGFLPPRMTLTERDAIASPAQGLMVYCTDCVPGGELSIYNGTNWTSMSMDQSGQNAASLPRTAIGSQVWNSNNLEVVKYRNGDPIPQVKDSATWSNLTTGAWCWYNNDSVNYANYGRLYNWYAVNDPRGFAPQGWHVPSYSEWLDVIRLLDPNADTSLQSAFVSLTAGTRLKDTTGWTNLPDSLCQGCTNGTNSTGFAAIPSGIRSSSGKFANVNRLGGFWTSSETDSLTAKLLFLQVYGDAVVINTNIDKKLATSVRVVRDQPSSGAFIPTISTIDPTNIDTSIASAGGIILEDGNASITSKGVCWSTTPHPTIDLISKTNEGRFSTDFVSNISALIPCTKYYVRAYATNSAGTGYGNELSFTTYPTPQTSFNPQQLLGDYTNSFDQISYSTEVRNYGPNTKKIISVQSLSEFTAEITVDNIWDSSWAPIKFLLNWTPNFYPSVTLTNQTNIGLGSTLVGTSSPYANWQIQVGPGTNSGTFSFCDETLTLNIRLGVLDPTTGQGGFFSNEYIVNMAR